jgi:hypothetical protein
MGVVAGDIKLYKSATVTDTDANGGAISATEIVSDTANNMFPNVTDAERTAGGVRYRKGFVKNTNTTTAFNNVYRYISELSDAADYFRIKEGTDTDTQADADDYTDWVGSGLLNSGISAGATTLIVDYDAADGVYNGSVLAIVDGADTEYVTVTASPSWTGNQATLTVSATAKGHTSGVVIATMIDLGDIAAEDSAGFWVKQTWAAGVASYSGSKTWFATKGESA